ncbi:hypothetical protein Tco_0919750 [Tanacetum coccineum]
MHGTNAGENGFYHSTMLIVPSWISTAYFEVTLEEAGNNCRRKEPDEPKDASKGRDVFNENPSRDQLLAVSDIVKPVTT